MRMEGIRHLQWIFCHTFEVCVCVCFKGKMFIVGCKHLEVVESNGTEVYAFTRKLDKISCNYELMNQIMTRL